MKNRDSDYVDQFRGFKVTRSQATCFYLALAFGICGAVMVALIMPGLNKYLAYVLVGISAFAGFLVGRRINRTYYGREK